MIAKRMRQISGNMLFSNLTFGIARRMQMLNGTIQVELALIPIAIDSLQVFSLSIIHLRSPLFKYLLARQLECKITILDQVFTLAYFVLLSVASRLKNEVPYTAACVPLYILVIQRFLWHRSITKAFKSP